MTIATECLISMQLLIAQITLFRVYKRKQRVTMKKWDNKKATSLDRFWVCMTHPEEKDANENYLP